MQNLQITFAYILNNGGQKIFISFLLCVWLAQFYPRLIDLFFNRKVFSFNYNYIVRQDIFAIGTTLT